MGFEGCRIRPAAVGQQCWVMHVMPCLKQRGDAPSGAGGCAVAAMSWQHWGGGTGWPGPPSWLCHIPIPCAHPTAKPGQGLVASPPQSLAPRVLPSPRLPPPAAA